jgi:tetratricopeptide (TPR) repeat protein
MGRKNLSDSEKAFRKAVEIDPRYAEARNNLAYLYEARGRLSEAIEELQKALEVNPEFSQARFSLGRLLVRQENFEEGIPHLVQALARASEDLQPSYLHALGLAFTNLGDIENGLRYLRLARGRATARQQTELLQSIDEDLQLLDGVPVLW